MRKLLALLLLWVCAPAFSANAYVCACGVGFATGCVPGSNTSPFDTPTKAATTPANFAVAYAARAAGEHLSSCQGGAMDAFATVQLQNNNATAANPVYIDSYDDTARWTGGAGIRPKFNNTSATNMFLFNKSVLTHTEGYVVKDIELVGNGTTTVIGMLFSGDDDYVTIDNVKVSGTTATAIQCSASSVVATASNDGISSHFIVRNSTIQSNTQLGIHSQCSDTLIEKNTFTLNGTGGGDHHIYMGGALVKPFPQTISSLSGNGVTSTLTTLAPHGQAIGSHVSIAVVGATPAGFNVTGGPGGVVATITGASTMTYASTGNGSASPVGTYQLSWSLPLAGMTIRNNTFTEGNVGAAGTCLASHLVVHGNWTGILIENNSFAESVASTNGACIGIEVSSGAYAQPEDFEQFRNVVIRNNTTRNLALGIGVDLAAQVLIENNYHYSTYSQNSTAGGIRMRSKNGVPTLNDATNKLPANGLSPNNVTIRYNTVYLQNVNVGHWGIALNGNVGDPLTGTQHNLYGNLVVLEGASLSTTTQCFDTENMTLAMFTVKDYNACYYRSATVPKWENSSTLAAIQAVADANKSDLHSLMATTADVTTGQPFLLTPTTTPTISTSSAAKNAGHPTLGPRTGWGGSVRTDATRDIGAFEFGATLGVVPDSPSGVH